MVRLTGADGQTRPPNRDEGRAVQDSDSPNDAQRIRCEATDWFVRLHESPAEPGPREAFDAWRAADPRHADSYARLQRLWGASAHIPGLANPRRTVSRRHALRTGAMAAAGVAGLVGAGRLVLGPHPFADHATETGERRTIALPDGSFAELSTETALNVRYGRTERTIELLGGEAFFQVAADPARPFRVLARGGTATALGTAFAVSATGDNARLIVTEHAVVARGGTRQARVGEGQGIWFGAAGVGAVEVGDANALAWRQGRLNFVARPLGKIVAELNRWSSGKIVVTDEVLAGKRATLMIGTEQADEAVTQIAAVIPMRVTRISGLLTLIRAPI